jgi:DNA-binding response OmpR family regulator
VEISLTTKEFAVLEYLVRRVDQVVTKSEIIGGVWDEAADPEPNLIEVYVSTLRRKVDVPFRRKSITTVRGIGYRLLGHGADA